MKRLTFEYIAIWVLAAVIDLLYNLHVLTQGVWATDGQVQYAAGSVCVLLTLGLIYLSLKLVSLSGVTRRIRQEGLSAYVRWAEIRMFLLAFIVYIDLCVYFATLQSLGGLCALISLLALLFIRPSRKEYERISADDAGE